MTSTMSLDLTYVIAEQLMQQILNVMKDGGVHSWDSVYEQSRVESERKFWYMIAMMSELHLIWFAPFGRGMIGIKPKGLKLLKMMKKEGG